MFGVSCFIFKHSFVCKIFICIVNLAVKILGVFELFIYKFRKRVRDWIYFPILVILLRAMVAEVFEIRFVKGVSNLTFRLMLRDEHVLNRVRSLFVPGDILFLTQEIASLFVSYFAPESWDVATGRRSFIKLLILSI